MHRCFPWTSRRGVRRRIACPALVLGAAVLAGCTPRGEYQSDSMWNGSRLRPMEGSPLPGQLSSARPLVAGTIPVGSLRRSDPVATGRERSTGQEERLLAQSPLPVTPALLAQGQEQFDVYCSPCHGRIGNGQGMIVKRGFPQPPDYAIPRLRQAPDGHFFDVITHGYGVMYSYADRVPVPDRWAIVAYIRLLQERRPVVLPDAGDRTGSHEIDTVPRDDPSPWGR